jgi:hypothetical protein
MFKKMKVNPNILDKTPFGVNLNQTTELHGISEIQPIPMALSNFALIPR